MKLTVPTCQEWIFTVVFMFFFVEGFDLKNGKSKSVEVDHTVDEKKIPKQPPEMVKNG